MLALKWPVKWISGVSEEPLPVAGIKEPGDVACSESLSTSVMEPQATFVGFGFKFDVKKINYWTQFGFI